MVNQKDINLVSWEAIYFDGTKDREVDGQAYKNINRASLKIFKLISIDNITLFETYTPLGLSGNNFIYRRRTSITNNKNHTIFILGWMPGPCFAVDVIAGTYRMLENGFDENDKDLYPPVPMSFEKYGSLIK